MHARGRHDVVTIPTIRIAFVLSILVHAALLWLVWPHLRSLTQASGRVAASLAVELSPRNDRIASASPPPAAQPPVAPAPPPVPQASPPPKPAPAARPAPARKRPAQTPKPAHPTSPVIAQRAPSPEPAAVAPARVPPPAPPTQATPAPSVAAAPSPPSPPTRAMPSPPAQDLASYVAAQRAARGEPADASPPKTNVESDIERRNRIVAANLGLNRTPSFGTDARNAGGLFQITKLNYDAARFYFFGYDKDIGRNARQLIEVRKGQEPDIRIAIVRRMIAIIRDSINGDFLWVSQRTGNAVTLSSRPADNAGLEAFILHDVFPDARQP